MIRRKGSEPSTAGIAPKGVKIQKVIMVVASAEARAVRAMRFGKSTWSRILKRAWAEVKMMSTATMVFTLEQYAKAKAERKALENVLVSSKGIYKKLMNADLETWQGGKNVRVYINQPVDFLEIYMGSNNKNRKANSGKLYFDFLKSQFVYEGPQEFESEIIEAAVNIFGGK